MRRFLGRFNQMEGAEHIQTPDARVISAADLPQFPAIPQKDADYSKLPPFQSDCCSGLQSTRSIGREQQLNPGFHTVAQIEHMLGLPVLCTLPEIGDVADPGSLVIDNPRSSFAEAVFGLQLGFTSGDRNPKVVVITSSIPNEGKTTLALSLARLAARAGLKTVSVDGDFRRPSIAKVIGEGKSGDGIIEAILGQVLDACFTPDPKSDVLALACLKPPARAADLMNSRPMQQLVKKLSLSFDLVVIDSPPVLPVNDARVLSRMADAVIFVVRWETTPREAAVRALRSLLEVDAPLVGVALTRTDVERFSPILRFGYGKYC